MGGMRIGRDAEPTKAWTAMPVDELLSRARQYSEQIRKGDGGHTVDFAQVFQELDERMSASNRPPTDWAVDW